MNPKEHTVYIIVHGRIAFSPVSLRVALAVGSVSVARNRILGSSRYCSDSVMRLKSKSGVKDTMTAPTEGSRRKPEMEARG